MHERFGSLSFIRFNKPIDQTDLDSKYATCINIYFCLLLVLVYHLPTDESLCYSISNLSSSHEINGKMVCALQKALELFP